jgi:2-polyprenyl-6-methoxyphenol hydroxylase-like FAD-dependent oxidoreductase
VTEMRDFDVAVVGASVAGCTADRLFAQAGARVALIEKRSVRPHTRWPARTIERLGLAPLRLHKGGALRTKAEVWTSYGGWLKFADSAMYSSLPGGATVLSAPR